MTITDDMANNLANDFEEIGEVLGCVYMTLLTEEIAPRKATEARELLKRARRFADQAHVRLHGAGSAAKHALDIDPDCPIHGHGRYT